MITSSYSASVSARSKFDRPGEEAMEAAAVPISCLCVSSKYGIVLLANGNSEVVAPTSAP